jgi:hypothetical protein
VNFAVMSLCVASQRVFIVVVAYIFIDSVRKLLDTPSYLLLTIVELYVEMFLFSETMKQHLCSFTLYKTQNEIPVVRSLASYV